jgi:ferric-dicitrate binding protein FerR (iron transport regulator)
MGEFDAWNVDEASPPGFAEKVAAAAWDSSRRRGARPRRVLVSSAVAGLASAAAVALVLHSLRPHGGTRGEGAAVGERREVPVGSRAVAVLEPGAHLSWSGDDVTQTEGDVFYRVEKQEGRAPFVVHTAVGDVTVLGTCFRVKVDDMNGRDIKVGAVGAAVGALALVGVYEGHVAVSHAGQRVDLRAGESAQVDRRGVHAPMPMASGEQAFSAAAAGEEPLLAANQNLAEQVASYKRQLAQNDEAKKALRAQLDAAESKLALQDGGARPRNPYDLSADDWKKLGKDGVVKALVPCGEEPWTPTASELEKLGLPPEDGPALAAAMSQSRQRVADVVMSGCTQLLGATLANRLGEPTCEAVIGRSAKVNVESADYLKVAQIRAGELPEPAPNDPAVDPLERMLLAQTGAMRQLEGDLAKTLGADEAHRVAFDDNLGGLCAMEVVRVPDGPKPTP